MAKLRSGVEIQGRYIRPLFLSMAPKQAKKFVRGFKGGKGLRAQLVNFIRTSK